MSENKNQTDEAPSTVVDAAGVLFAPQNEMFTVDTKVAREVSKQGGTVMAAPPDSNTELLIVGNASLDEKEEEEEQDQQDGKEEQSPDAKVGTDELHYMIPFSSECEVMKLFHEDSTARWKSMGRVRTKVLHPKNGLYCNIVCRNSKTGGMMWENRPINLGDRDLTDKKELDVSWLYEMVTAVKSGDDCHFVCIGEREISGQNPRPMVYIFDTNEQKAQFRQAWKNAYAHNLRVTLKTYSQ